MKTLPLQPASSRPRSGQKLAEIWSKISGYYGPLLPRLPQSAPPLWPRSANPLSWLLDWPDKPARRRHRKGRQQAGTVALVGAGPGACDLITLRGLRRLQAADVIFYDRLVDPEVLALAPARAERIYVGKAPGQHHWTQDKICAALVAVAGQGKRVVRLKCGDPGVFARGAEEVDALSAANIPYEIVAGVTAASAASAALGGFLTERGTCDTLVLATGQTQKAAGNANWIAQLQPGTRMAIYMGVGAAAEITKALTQAGLAQEVSIDIVSRAEHSDQVVAHCRAATLQETIRTSGVSNPAIMFLTRPHLPS